MLFLESFDLLSVLAPCHDQSERGLSFIMGQFHFFCFPTTWNFENNFVTVSTDVIFEAEDLFSHSRGLELCSIVSLVLRNQALHLFCFCNLSVFRNEIVYHAFAIPSILKWAVLFISTPRIGGKLTSLAFSAFFTLRLRRIEN